MTMADCPHGMPNPKTCMDCMEEGIPPDRPHWHMVGGIFLAQYSGVCAGCGDSWSPGSDMIQRWDLGNSEDTKYTHAGGCKP